MKKIYAMMVVCLSIMSFHTYGEDCSNSEGAAFCNVDMSVNQLIDDVDLSQFKSLDTLLDYSKNTCDQALLVLQDSVTLDLIAKDICMNKFSIAWMVSTLMVNNEKISNLSQDIVENKLSLEKMNVLIVDKKEQIEQLRQ